MRTTAGLGPSAGRAALDDRYFPLSELSIYAGLSIRTLRNHLTHLVHPLPCYRIGGKVLVRRSDFDRWAEQFRVASHTVCVEALVNEVVQGLG